MITRVEDCKSAIRDAVDPNNQWLAMGLGDLVVAARQEGAEQGLDMAQRWIDSEFNQGRHVISLRKSDLLAAILASPAAGLPVVYGDPLPIKET